MGTVDRQASETENTNCSTEETEASKLLQEHSLPYSRPFFIAVSVGSFIQWLSQKYHGPTNQPIGHPNPKSKTRLYNTGISCDLFL